MDRLQLTALYTLQDGLARNAEQVSGFEHGHVTVGHALHEARAQLFGETNAPRRNGRDLFAGDETIVELAMQGRGCDVQLLRAARSTVTASAAVACCGGSQHGMSHVDGTTIVVQHEPGDVSYAAISSRSTYGRIPPCL